MARKPKKRAPPSRIKYEKSHPTVSCRVSKELYDRLVESKNVDGKSFADILKIGLGIAEKDDRKIIKVKEKSWQKGYDIGYNEGFEDAKSEVKKT